MMSNNKLTAIKVKNTNKPGRYPDGGGLFLQVRSAKSKSWVFRFKINGKAKEMGLGTITVVPLNLARKKVIENKQMILEGKNPIVERKAQKLRNLSADVPTFSECAKEFIHCRQEGWKNEKHKEQWKRTLEVYTFPIFGRHPVDQVSTELVLKAIRPIWYEKTETADRVRSRVENILDWAKIKGYRNEENPARWRGHLSFLLPSASKTKKVNHHKALSHHEIGNFLCELRKSDGVSARALEFCILTATRTGEVLHAKWSEISFENETWTIPASRMKSEKEHRVPLSTEAISILAGVARHSTGEYIFTSLGRDRPMSTNSMLMTLRNIENEVTVHGFRSTFRDWTAEKTAFAREVCEAALAHVVLNKTEAAYRRGDLFLKRKKLMNEWASYCNHPKAPSAIAHIREKNA